MKIRLPENQRTRLAVKNVAVSFIIKGLSILVSFVLFPMTLDYLNSYEYGIWLTLSSILAWIYIFDIGIANGLRNKLAEALAKQDFEQGRIYVSTALCSLGIIVIVFYVLYMFFAPIIDWYKILNVEPSIVPNLEFIVAVVFLFVCIGFVFRTIGTIYQAYQLPAVSDFFGLLGSLLSLLVIFILTKTTTGSLNKVAYTYAGVPILVYFISIPYTFKRFREIAPSFKAIKFKYFKGLTSLGLKFMIVQICALILYMTSNVIISNRFGPEDVTPYNVAFKYFSIITMGFTILISPLWSAVTNAITLNDFNWVKDILRKLMSAWGISILIAVLLFLFSSVFYRLWIGDKLTIPVSLSFWCMLYVIIAAGGNIFSNIINGFGKLYLQILLAVIQALIFIPLSLILADYLGVAGIIASLTIVSFCCSVFGPIQVYKLVNGKARGVWRK